MLYDQHAFLYSIHGGKFVMFEGGVRLLNKHMQNKATSFYTNRKRLICSSMEGIVYNETVWLSKRDDVKAREILINYETFCIEELEDKKEAHKRKIEGLVKE